MQKGWGSELGVGGVRLHDPCPSSGFQDVGVWAEPVGGLQQPCGAWIAWSRLPQE